MRKLNYLPSAPVDFMDEEAVADSNVDDDSLSDVGVKESDSMKATHNFFPDVLRGNKGKQDAGTKLMKRRYGLAHGVLGRSYSVHPICNAFDCISFGSNPNEIHRATLDDTLQFCDSGLFLYMGQVGDWMTRPNNGNIVSC
jgi:hypothetical protein